MMRTLLAFTVVACLGASLSTAAVPADWTVYLRRAGPLRIGMSLGQVRVMLGDGKAVLVPNAPGGSLDDCVYLRSTLKPEPLSVMFSQGRVVRVDVRGAGVRTASRVGVGSTETT